MQRALIIAVTLGGLLGCQPSDSTLWVSQLDPALVPPDYSGKVLVSGGGFVPLVETSAADPDYVRVNDEFRIELRQGSVSLGSFPAERLDGAVFPDGGARLQFDPPDDLAPGAYDVVPISPSGEPGEALPGAYEVDDGNLAGLRITLDGGDKRYVQDSVTLRIEAINAVNQRVEAPVPVRIEFDSPVMADLQGAFGGVSPRTTLRDFNPLENGRVIEGRLPDSGEAVVVFTSDTARTITAEVTENSEAFDFEPGADSVQLVHFFPQDAAQVLLSLPSEDHAFEAGTPEFLTIGLQDQAGNPIFGVSFDLRLQIECENAPTTIYFDQTFEDVGHGDAVQVALTKSVGGWNDDCHAARFVVEDQFLQGASDYFTVNPGPIAGLRIEANGSGVFPGLGGSGSGDTIKEIEADHEVPTFYDIELLDAWNNELGSAPSDMSLAFLDGASGERLTFQPPTLQSSDWSVVHTVASVTPADEAGTTHLEVLIGEDDPYAGGLDIRGSTRPNSLRVYPGRPATVYVDGMPFKARAQSFIEVDLTVFDEYGNEFPESLLDDRGITFQGVGMDCSTVDGYLLEQGCQLGTSTGNGRVVVREDGVVRASTWNMSIISGELDAATIEVDESISLATGNTSATIHLFDEWGNTYDRWTELESITVSDSAGILNDRDYTIPASGTLETDLTFNGFGTTRIQVWNVDDLLGETVIIDVTE